MVNLKRLSGVMEHPTAYRLWQSPFVSVKFAPVFKHNDLRRPPGAGRRLRTGNECAVLRGGGLCWRRHQRELCSHRPPPASPRVHHRGRLHLPSAARRAVRFHFAQQSAASHRQRERRPHPAAVKQATHRRRACPRAGTRAAGRTRAAAAVGQVRSRRLSAPLDEWRALFTESFDEVIFEPFPVGRLGVTFFEMVYFKGKARR